MEIYVYDVLLFGPDQGNIDEVIKEFKDYGLYLNVVKYVYDLLRIEVNTDKKSDKVTLVQGGLTKKVLKTVRILYSNNKTTPSATLPLGIDDDVPPFDKTLKYASVVRMLVYLSINPTPDTQFVVKHCDRFTQKSRTNHDEAVERTCRYLVETQWQGLTFDYNSVMNP